MFDQDQDTNNDYVYKNIANQMDNRQLRNPNNVWDNREPEQARFDLYMKYREKELAKNDPEYQKYLRNIEKKQV